MAKTGFRPRLGALLLAAIALAGCGDSNVFRGASSSSGYQADLERGRAEMDEGNWDAAIATFQGMEKTPEVRKYLASCYMGKTGFDALTLVQNISDANDASVADNTVLYDSVTKIFDRETPAGTIDNAALSARLALMTAALDVLGGYSPTPGIDGDAAFQAGFFASVRAVLSVVGQLVYPADPTRRVLTVAALKDVKNTDPGVILSATVPPTLDNDLRLVKRGIDTLAPDNDIAEDLRNFLVKIGYLAPDNSVRGVTDNTVRTFLLEVAS